MRAFADRIFLSASVREKAETVQQNMNRTVRDKPREDFGAAAVPLCGQQLCIKTPSVGTILALYFCQMGWENFWCWEPQNCRLDIQMTYLITTRKPLCLYDISEEAAGIYYRVRTMVTTYSSSLVQVMPGIITNSAPFTLECPTLKDKLHAYLSNPLRTLGGRLTSSMIWPCKSLWVRVKPCMDFGLRKWQMYQS